MLAPRPNSIPRNFRHKSVTLPDTNINSNNIKHDVIGLKFIYSELTLLYLSPECALP